MLVTVNVKGKRLKTAFAILIGFGTAVVVIQVYSSGNLQLAAVLSRTTICPKFKYDRDKKLLIYGTETYETRGKCFRPPGDVEQILYSNGSIFYVCPFWSYDPSEWTLRYAREKFLSENKCNTFEYLQVRQIIDSSGNRELRGCNAKTPRCPDLPFYDEYLKVRINLPPCCRQNIITMFHRFTAELKEQNIIHMLSYGGVIGWYRNKKMIPYDLDLDVFVEMAVWKSDKLEIILRNLHDMHGHIWEYQDDYSMLKLIFSNMNSLSIDVWPMKEVYDYAMEEEMIAIDSKDFPPQRKSNMLPPMLDVFEGVPTYLPQKPEQFLNVLYGNNLWKQPLLCKEKNSWGDCIV